MTLRAGSRWSIGRWPDEAGPCRSSRQRAPALAAALAACVPVTVNVTFPQQKLDDAASQIVDMSRRPGGRAAARRPRAGAHPQARLEPRPVARARWGPARRRAEERRIDVAQAQAPKTDSEELRRLTESQNRRLGALQQWMARGCVGESNQGLVEPRPGAGLLRRGGG